MLRFDKAIYLSLLFKSILSDRLSNSLRRLNISLFLEFIKRVSILFYKVIEFTILFYTFFSNIFYITQRMYNLTDFIYYVFR